MAGSDSKSDPAIPFTDFKKAGRKAENPLSHPEEGAEFSTEQDGSPGQRSRKAGGAAQTEYPANGSR